MECEKEYSNHYPVLTKVNVSHGKRKKIPRWKLGDADWDAFQRIRINRSKIDRCQFVI